MTGPITSPHDPLPAAPTSTAPASTPAATPARTPWIAPAVQVIAAGQAEVGTRASADGTFTTS